MSLLRRRALLAASQSSNSGGGGGGGDVDINAPIILDIQSEVFDTWHGVYMIDVYIYSSEPISTLPFNMVFMSVNAFDNYNGSYGKVTCSYMNPSEADLFYAEDAIPVEAEMLIEGSITTDIEFDKLYASIASFAVYDLEKRIIPTCIHTERLDINTWQVGSTYGVMSMGQYLYQTNINCIPISDDYIGSNSEPCPIKKMGNIDNTEGGRYVWYNYGGEILFKDTYYSTIYALNSSGTLYLYN